VQVIPHVTDAIKEFITSDLTDEDFVLVEIGGTIGDIEGLPFVEAIRQLGNERGRDHTLYAHVTLVPYIGAAGELKTKPTQHSVKELLSLGIQPDILLCRCDREIPEDSRRKLALFCNVQPDRVIQALDVDTIYDVPIAYHDQGLDEQVLKHFGINKGHEDEVELSRWNDIVGTVRAPEGEVTIGVVGKYTNLLDAYKSLSEALSHGGIANKVRVNLNWLESEIFEQGDTLQHLEGCDGILVPGGFGERGAEGKINAVRFARERQIPYFGICFGMQMAVIEAGRSLAGMPNAGSTEFGDCEEPLVGLLTEWSRGNVVERRNEDDDLGGTMRLGAYPCRLRPGSRAAEIYSNNSEIRERHRHRYEVNINYMKRLEQAGLVFSGMSPDGELPEIVEIPDHPWFVGVQFHPELKSKPFEPHPIFTSFIKAAVDHSGDHRRAVCDGEPAARLGYEWRAQGDLRKTRVQAHLQDLLRQGQPHLGQESARRGPADRGTGFQGNPRDCRLPGDYRCPRSAGLRPGRRMRGRTANSGIPVPPNRVDRDRGPDRQAGACQERAVFGAR
jgi:CTP synthase